MSRFSYQWNSQQYLESDFSNIKMVGVWAEGGGGYLEFRLLHYRGWANYTNTSVLLQHRLSSSKQTRRCSPSFKTHASTTTIEASRWTASALFSVVLEIIPLAVPSSHCRKSTYFSRTLYPSPEVAVAADILHCYWVFWFGSCCYSDGHFLKIMDEAWLSKDIQVILDE